MPSIEVMTLPLVTTWMVSSPAVPDIARVSVAASRPPLTRVIVRSGATVATPPMMVSTPPPIVYWKVSARRPPIRISLPPAPPLRTLPPGSSLPMMMSSPWPPVAF
jgi:hypothetical protein